MSSRLSEESLLNRVWEAIIMARTVGIGIQSFEKLIEQDIFYVDKTDFIRQWWENRDDVTLLTRPRRNLWRRLRMRR